MPLLFEQIPATRLEQLSREKTVFFFAVGPLEDHGPHLPLGQDLLEADGLARRMAERLEADLGWTAVLMPRAPLGIDSNTTGTAITVRAHVLRDWLVDACHCLSRLGFRHFVCFSGNLGPRQLTAIEEAGRLLRRRAGGWWPVRLYKGWSRLPVLVSASSALADFKEFRESPLRPDPAEHGGRMDTSVGLALFPELVAPEYASLPARPREGTKWTRLFRRLSRQSRGYWGDPSESKAETGSATLSDRVGQVYPKLRAVWEGSSPEALFRSWYSVLPPNRSFFCAWLLALSAAMILLTGAYISFQLMVGPQ